ncbi:hypothetical protein, partial [Streptomyces sp. NPDC001226]
ESVTVPVKPWTAETPRLYDGVLAREPRIPLSYSRTGAAPAHPAGGRCADDDGPRAGPPHGRAVR